MDYIFDVDFMVNWCMCHAENIEIGEFYFVDRASLYNLVNNSKLGAQFCLIYLFIYLSSLLVSGIRVPIS